jgi:hypothetical protein
VAINKRVFQGTANGAEEQSYRMMQKRLNDALSGRGSEVMGSLFSDAERATLRRYADELGHLAETTQKQNASGTAYKASQIVRQVMGMALGASAEAATGGMTGGIAGMVGGSLAARAGGSMLGGMQARSATQGTASLARLPVSDLVRFSLQMGTQATGRQTDGR